MPRTKDKVSTENKVEQLKNRIEYYTLKIEEAKMKIEKLQYEKIDYNGR